MGFNRFDGIIYLNLAHREDRKKELLAELEKLNVSPDKIHRIEPVHDVLNGHRGCALAHATALRYAIDHKWNNVLILEDDFTTSKTEKEVSTILSCFDVLENQFDVLLLGGNIMDYEPTALPSIFRVLSSQCAHAYVVNKHYFTTLMTLFYYCYQQMLEEPFFTESLPNAIDQKWKCLMVQDRWYMSEIFAQQRNSFSDIIFTDRDRKHQETFD